MKKMIVNIMAVILCLIILLPNFIYATGINTEAYADIYTNDKKNEKIITAGNKVLGVIQIIGVASAVVLLLILGIKYMAMVTSANDKATIKEKLIPYAIGAILLFGGTGILSIVANFAQKMGK